MLTSALSLYIASILSLGETYTTNNKLPALPIQSISLNAEISAIPVKKAENIAPVIEASAAIAVDLGSGEILYKKNIHERLQFASLTKIMTAVIAVEENNLDEVVKISDKAANTIGSQMYLYKDEEIQLQNLIYGLIVHSANDAAIAIAEHNAGSEEEFVKKMNKRAKQLRLRNTNFSNPIGFDHNKNYSSVYDLSVLSKYAYQKKILRHASSFSNIEVKSNSGGIKHNLENTNKILDNYLGFKGFKTGRTDIAGECFIGIAENKEGREIMTIVLNSPNRFKESKIMADWVFRSYVW